MQNDVVGTLEDGTFVFFCPGCRELHGVWVSKPNDLTGARWSWNGDKKKPSFYPSLFIHKPRKCHSFVREGRIQFLQDCEHDMRCKTVPLPAQPFDQ